MPEFFEKSSHGYLVTDLTYPYLALESARVGSTDWVQLHSGKWIGMMMNFSISHLRAKKPRHPQRDSFCVANWHGKTHAKT